MDDNVTGKSLLWTWPSRTLHWLREHPRVFLLVFAGVWAMTAIGIGWAYAQGAPRDPIDLVLHSVFSATQMIVFGGGLQEPATGYSYAAQRAGQFLLPLLAFVSVRESLRRWMQNNEEQDLKERLNALDKHIVFLGHGKFARKLASQYRKLSTDNRIVAVDLARPVPDGRDLSAPVFLGVQGDAKDVGLLAKLNLERARIVYIDVGTDQDNYLIADSVSKVLTEKAAAQTSTNEAGPKVFVHIQDLQYEKAVGSLKADHCEMRGFSLGTTAARQLLGTHPPARTRAESEPAVHILLAGYGWMGKSLLTEIFKTCHYRDRRPVRVTIVHQDADRIQNEVESDFPFLAAAHSCEGPSKSSVAVMRYIKAKPERLTLDQLGCGPDDHSDKVAPDIAYVIADDGIVNQAIADRLVQLKTILEPCEKHPHEEDFRIVLCADQSPGESRHDHWEIFDSSEQIIGKIDAFNEFPGAYLDAIGKQIHFSYQEKGAGTVDNCWTVAKPFERLSSNASADHLWLKTWAYVDARQENVALLEPKDWRYWEAGSPVDKLIDDLGISPKALLREIGEMEHRRFCAERFVEGWLYHPQPLPAEAAARRTEKTRRRNFRLNETLRPFDQLDDRDRDATINSFEDSLNALKAWCCAQQPGQDGRLD